MDQPKTQTSQTIQNEGKVHIYFHFVLVFLLRCIENIKLWAVKGSNSPSECMKMFQFSALKSPSHQNRSKSLSFKSNFPD